MLNFIFTRFKFFLQRVFRGWDDSETWDLEFEFLKWIFPRLKRFAKISIAYPPQFSEKEWDNFLNQLIKRTEKVLVDYERLYEMEADEEARFTKEKQEVIQLICDNIKDFSW